MVTGQRLCRHSLAALAIALCCGLIVGCADQKPVFYGNQSGGTQAAVRKCESQAREHGLSYSDSNRVARQSAENGAVGAAGGAVAGAIYGNAGHGAAAGAAGGVVTGLTHALLKQHQPSPIYRRYVNRCLRDRGYQPIGWH